MPIFRPTELVEFLERLGQGPKRTLSQNFLVDGNIIRKILGILSPGVEDTILEIGPGPGALTEFFFTPREEGGFPVHTVLAIEKDDQFAQKLSRFQHPGGARLSVLNKDVLDVRFEDLVRDEPISREHFKVVSSVPYHVTTPLIKNILLSSHLFDSATLIVQHEVGEKIVASPSLLSLWSSYYSETLSYALFLPKSCFFPKPRVGSCVVSMKFRKTPLLEKPRERLFFSLLDKAFHSPRKILSSSLQGIFDTRASDIKQELISLDLSPEARPEELSFQQWLALFAALEY